MMLESIQQKLQSLDDNIAATKRTNAELSTKLRNLQVRSFTPHAIDTAAAADILRR